MHLIKAIAIDDEPKALEVVQMHAAKVPFLSLANSFTNAFNAIQYLQSHKIDLMFLDIKMPDISGIEFIGCLSKPPLIIFTTAYSEYAVQGFELDAVDYLLKPFSLVRFAKSCNKALEILSNKNGGQEKFIFLKTGYEEEKVMLKDIIYVEAEGNYVSIVTPGKKLLSRQSVTEILTQLPEMEFIRIHRSFVIALNKIEKIGRQEIVVGGKSIPIGASYEEKLIEIRTRMRVQ